MASSTVYVVSLEHWYDDYKRAESSMESIGLFTSKLAAYKAGWKVEILKNAHSRDFKNIKGHLYIEHYRDLASIADVQDLERLIRTMNAQREHYLGYGQFTMQSTGYRLHVEELSTDQGYSGDQKSLRKMERTLLQVLSTDGGKESVSNEEDDENEE
jgi:hypothetical protein